MKRITRYLQFTVLALVCSVWGASAVNADARLFSIKRDPFMHPRLAAEKPKSEFATAQANHDATSDATASEWRPQLRAIIYDRDRPLVNINGQTIGLGESIQGFRLQQVYESEVILVKEDQQIRLRIDEVALR